MAHLREAVTLDDLERYAATYLDKTVFDYFSTGADDDVTLHENRQAFKRYTHHVQYYPDPYPKLTLTLTHNY